MAYTTQYIGSRYVPMFADPPEWDSTRTYEPLTIVLNKGNSYTSRQFVPVGVELTNTDYWLETGNYNAQVEQYRQTVIDVQEQVTTNTENIANNTENIATITPFDSIPTTNSNKGVTSDGIFNAFDNIGGYMPLTLIGRINYAEKSFYANGYTNAQAGVYYNGYYYVPFINTSTNAAIIAKIDMSSGNIDATNVIANAGHCNGACVGNNEIVFLPSFDTNGNRFDAFAINPITLEQTNTYTITNLPASTQVFAIGYDNDNKFYYLLTADNSTIYKLDSSFNYVSSTAIIMPENYKVQINRNGGNFHNGKFFAIFNNENTLMGFDCESGKLVQTYNIGQYQGSNFIAELENFTIIDNAIYLNSNVPYTNTFRGLYFWKGNLNGAGYPNNYGIIASNFTSDMSYYVDQNTFNFSPNGQSNNKFNWVAEALIAARGNIYNETSIRITPSASVLEDLYIYRENVNLFTNGASFNSVRINDSIFYADTLNISGYVNFSPDASPYSSIYSNTSFNIKNSKVTLSYVSCDIEEEPEDYCALYANGKSTLYIPRISSSNSIFSKTCVILGNVNSAVNVNILGLSSINTLNSYNENVSSGATFNVPNSKLVMVLAAIPSHPFNKCFIPLMTGQSSNDIVGLLSDSTNLYMVSFTIANNVLTYKGIKKFTDGAFVKDSTAISVYLYTIH